MADQGFRFPEAPDSAILSAGNELGLLYLAFARNLVVPIVAHGAANTLAFVLIFFDRYPGV